MGAGAAKFRKYLPQRNNKTQLAPEDANSLWRKPRTKEEVSKAKKAVKAPEGRRISKEDDEGTELVAAIEKIWSKLLEENTPAPRKRPEPILAEQLQEKVEARIQKLESAQQLLRAANGRFQSAQVEYKNCVVCATERGIPGEEYEWAVGKMALRKGEVSYVQSMHEESGSFFYEVRPWNSIDDVGTESSKLIAPMAEDAEELKKAVDSLKHSKEELKKAESIAMEADEELKTAHENLRKNLNLPKDRMLPPPPGVLKRKSSMQRSPQLPDMEMVKKWTGALEADKEKPEPIPYPEVRGLKERAGVGDDRSFKLDRGLKSNETSTNECITARGTRSTSCCW